MIGLDCRTTCNTTGAHLNCAGRWRMITYFGGNIARGVCSQCCMSIAEIQQCDEDPPFQVISSPFSFLFLPCSSSRSCTACGGCVAAEQPRSTHSRTASETSFVHIVDRLFEERCGSCENDLLCKSTTLLRAIGPKHGCTSAKAG